MNEFNRLLNEALNNLEPVGSPNIDPQLFVQLINAIASSADQTRVDAALQRAAQMDKAQLIQIMGQVTSIGDTTAMHNALQSKPERAMAVLEIAKKVMDFRQLEAFIETDPLLRAALTPAMYPDKPAEIVPAEDDDYYDEGDDDTGHKDKDDVEEEYNVEGDYYSQGEDSGGGGC